MTIDRYRSSSAAAITPRESLRAAAQRMEAERLGFLVVIEEERLVGVLTDRDIVLELAEEDCEIERRSVQDAMSRSPVTVAADAPLEEAVASMRWQGVRRLPVVDREQHVVGIVAADDLLRLFSRELAALAAVAQAQAGEQRHGEPVAQAPGSAERGRAEHYLKPVLSARREASVRQICADMKARAVGCAVITDESEAPVGILTDRDIVLRVVAAGLDPAATTAAAVMSSPVATAKPCASIEELAELMCSRCVRRVPIAKEGRVVGIVTYDDLVVTLGAELRALGTSFVQEQRRERVVAQLERVRDEVGEKLEDLSRQLSQLGDQALRHAASQIGAVREKLRRAVR